MPLTWPSVGEGVGKWTSSYIACGSKLVHNFQRTPYIKRVYTN